MLIINLKHYLSEKKTINLIKKTGKLRGVYFAVPDAFISQSAKYAKILAEHVDYQKPGRATGFIIPEEIKQAGAKGSLINHSEHTLKKRIIKKTIKRCKELELLTIVCVSNIKLAKKVLKWKPKAIAFEDPELISTGKAVSKYKSEDVKKFASLFKGSEVIPLCGAGISSRDDITAAKKLGCKGVLVSSAVALSKNPVKKLKELIK